MPKKVSGTTSVIGRLSTLFEVVKAQEQPPPLQAAPLREKLMTDKGGKGRVGANAIVFLSNPSVMVPVIVPSELWTDKIDELNDAGSTGVSKLMHIAEPMGTSIAPSLGVVLATDMVDETPAALPLLLPLPLPLHDTWRSAVRITRITRDFITATSLDSGQ